MMYPRIPSAALLVLFAFAAHARAGVRALEQSVDVNGPAGTATFSLFFNHAPDLHSTDAAGRPVDSFQIEVDGAWRPGKPPLQELTAIMRGDEIHLSGALPIRAAGPPVDDPHAGGWGAIIDSIPFTTTGKEVKFTAPLADLGAPGGVFAYRAFTMQDGQITAAAEASAVPLPEALTAGACGLVVVGALVRPRRVRRQFIYLARPNHWR
jgi:hypothetical protein